MTVTEKPFCNQYENAVFNLTNTRLHTFWPDWFQAMPVVLQFYKEARVEK